MFKSGTCVKTYKGHTDGVFCVIFGNKEESILSLSIDKTVCQWDFTPLQELIDETRERFKNNPLKKEDRKKYYLE